MQRQFERLLDYTLPMVSLVKGQRISASIEARWAAGTSRISGCRSTACRPTSRTSQLEVHRRGSAAHAVRASVAIPGILPPVPFGDDLLVDGGVLNNMPFEAMRSDRRIDTVIAVDVAPDRGPRAKLRLRHLGVRVQGAGVDVRAARRRATRASRACCCAACWSGAVHNQRLSSAEGAIDLLVKLDLPGVGLLDFKRVARGRATAATRSSIDTVAEWAAAQAGSVGVVILLTVRDLGHRFVRFVVVVVLAAVVFALLFVMTGLVEQFNREPYDTTAAIGGSAWVLAEGVAGPFTASSSLPASAIDALDAEVTAPVVAARSSLGHDGSTRGDRRDRPRARTASAQPPISDGRARRGSGRDRARFVARHRRR